MNFAKTSGNRPTTKGVQASASWRDPSSGGRVSRVWGYASTILLPAGQKPAGVDAYRPVRGVFLPIQDSAGRTCVASAVHPSQRLGLPMMAPTEITGSLSKVQVVVGFLVLLILGAAIVLGSGHRLAAAHSQQGSHGAQVVRDLPALPLWSLSEAQGEEGLSRIRRRVELGQLSAARRMVEPMARESAEAALMLALIEERLGNRSEARALLRRAGSEIERARPLLAQGR